MADGIPTDPPTSREIDFGALVRRALGDEFHKHEKVYQVGKGRTFESSDYGTQGIYGAARSVIFSGTAAGGSKTSIILGTEANGNGFDYGAHQITVTDFALTTQTSTIVAYNESTKSANVVPAWSSNFVLHTGTAQGAGSDYLTLGTGAPSVVSGTLSLTSGAGSTQSRDIISYDDSSKQAVVSKWDAPYLSIGSDNDGAQATFYLNFPDLGAGQVDTTPTFGTVSPTFTRATKAWTRNAALARVEVASGVPRSYYDASGNYLGYLAEGARTNHFFNSDAPITQTSPSLGTGTYTLWIEGTGSIAVAQNTATITGAGTATAGAPVTFVVTGAGTVDYTVTGSPTFAQSENGTSASTWIVTAGASVTRNADVLTYPTSPWFSNTAGTMFAEAMPLSSSGAQSIVGASTGGYFINRGSSFLGVAFDGSSVVTAGSAWTYGLSRKMVTAWSGVEFQACLSGTVGTAGVYDGSWGAGPLSIGLDNISGAFFGPIRRVAYFPLRLLNATLVTLTDSGLTFDPSTFPVALPDNTTAYKAEKVGPGVNTTYSIT